MSEFQIQERAPTRACVIFPNVATSKDNLSPTARLEEAVGLAHSINLEVAHSEIIKLREIKAGNFFG